MWHKFGLSDVYLVCLSGFIVFRLVDQAWSRRRAARMDRMASDWPVMPGQVSAARMDPFSSRLVVTYKSTAHGYLIDSWKHDFGRRAEAAHAKRALAEWECPVRYDPGCPEKTTLLWSDVQARVASLPFTAEIKPLTRAGYRWMIGFAVAGLGGLAACLVVYGMAMAGTAVCVCDAIIVLLLASVGMLPAGCGMWATLGEAVRAGWFPIRVWRVMSPWERWALGAAVAAGVVSVRHFAPAWRAIPIGADIPDKVMAGMALGLEVPAYLLCGLGALKMLRLRRPVAGD